MLIRRAGPDDLAALQSCFFASVSVLAAPHYTPEQRRAWVERALSDAASWREKLVSNTVWHALEGDVVAGFCSLTHAGLVDWLFVHPAFARKGVARALLEQAETMARYEGLTRMDTFASLAAQPVFAACGFTLDYRQDVDVNGIKLENAHMVRELG
ncbi:GNAT family N-acetyltransferase [Amantichitinum ursilacus]|uniref:Putative N-acetyltransferase YafP n=1 Tax=Amantichitinum ursilacus TaxID=857265 RepID=A0A0N1JTJ2_9NEIS|nr:GNAT family N-acetyltransferase [Amantichitinum ursilacus]KPC54458.1 putative N-acetyltransferase YafP [Amantichitinum ursilacus]